MNQQPPSEQPLNWKREEPIAVPLPGSERRMAIRHSDWARIRRIVSRGADPVPRLSLAYSILFGVFATAGLSIIPLALSAGLPPWVIPLYVILSVFSLLCGGVFVWLDIHLRSGKKTALEDCVDDMDDIEKMFET